jgi:muconate cycloisomerase
MSFRIRALRTHRLTREVNPSLFIVSSLGEHRYSHYLIVEAELEDGSIGWGEATVTPRWSGETQRGAEALVEEYLAPLLEGKEFETPGETSQPMERVVKGNSFTRAAVEMALWDAYSRSRGVPLWKALNPALDAPAHPSILLRGSIAALPPEQAVSRARALRDRGLRAFKVKVGRDPLGEGADRDRSSTPLQADIDRVRAVREAIGAGVKLGVDANGGWEVQEAIATLALLKELDLQYSEQPIAPGDPAGMAQVRREAGVPVMADEGVWVGADLLQLFDAGAIDFVNIYPGKMGGLCVCGALHGLAHSFGLKCTFGSNLETEIGTAAALHLVAALPEMALSELHTDLIGPLYYEIPSSRPGLHLVDGGWKVPEGPGLGVDFWDES